MVSTGTPRLLNRQRSHVLLVDVQEKFRPTIAEIDRVIDRSSLVLKAAARLGIPVTISEQYPKGLGNTLPELVSLAEGAPVFAKTLFSCVRDPALATRFNELRAAGRDQIVLLGIEAHVCVLQTAVDLMEAGWEVFVAADAVGSRHLESVALAGQRLRHLGAAVINAEMALFEWMEQSGTDEFKELSKLLR